MSLAHEVGLVSLKVACEGFVVSNSVIFEYKERSGSSQLVKADDWLTMDGEYQVVDVFG